MKLYKILLAIYENQRVGIYDQHGRIISRGARKLIDVSLFESEVIEITVKNNALRIEVRT